MEAKNPVDMAADAVGGLVHLASLLGLSIQTVSNWKVRGVPVERCVAVEYATGGKVTRRQLRPDDWQAIWPEEAGEQMPRAGEEERRAA
jgi:DNA-binding transcriptional regulator YdaS (Cro superfamily)